MCWNLDGFIFLVCINAYISQSFVWCSQNSIVWIRIQSNKSLLVWTGFDCINQAKIIKVINVGSLLEHHNDPIGE